MRQILICALILVVLVTAEVPTTLMPTTAMPTTRNPTTRAPTTRSPTRAPTTRAPTTRTPTRAPTTRTPTRAPTTRAPTTRTPTRAPTTRTPTRAPTTRAPTTRSPTNPPTTRTPTRSPTTRTPTTLNPTRAPTTRTPTRAPTTRTPTTPGPTNPPTTRTPTRSPTTRAPTTGTPTRSPTTRTPTTLQPTGGPTTRNPTRAPTTRTPTRAPTTRAPTTRRPTRAPTTLAPTGAPTLPASDCAWCPYECVQVPNPPFDTACDLSIVLIVDESYSIYQREGDDFDYTPVVRSAIKAFWTALGTVADIGGSAKLGGVVFGAVSMTFTNNKIRTLTQDYIDELNAWADHETGTNGYSPVDYAGPNRRGGFTNWGSSFRLTRVTPWTDEDNLPIKPAMAVMFTDGQPTRADPFDCVTCASSCIPACPANAAFDNYTFSDSGTQAIVATSCYQAQLLKEDGTRLFIVGVGALGVDGYRMIAAMTGPTAWNLAVDQFSTSDYVLNPALDELAAVLYSVAVGLCPCLQQQPLCKDDQTFPNRACIHTFSARVRVSSASATAVYPANAISVAYMYYDFSGATTQRVGYQFFDPSSTPPAGQPLVTPPVRATAMPYPSYVREDIHDPCEITRRVECTSGCFLLTDRQFAPRLFHEEGDTLTALLDAPLDPTGGACPIVYEKASTLDPEYVQYIWGAQVGNKFILCAAMTSEGSLFEFLDGTVPGSEFGLSPDDLNQRPVAYSNAQGAQTLAGGQPFVFDRAGGCNTVLCRTPVEVIFVVDEQSAVPISDFSVYRTYLSGIVDQFDTQGLIRFGLVWTNDGTPVGGVSPTLDTVVFDNNHDNFKNKLSAHPKKGGSTDFAKSIDFAIEKAWPAPRTASAPARHLVVLVGGSDSPSGGPTWEQVRAKRDARGVEVWGIGINMGASNIQFLDNFASTINYKHTSSFPTASLLSFDTLNIGSRLCPGTAQLCDGCGGFCACPGQCSCPTCVDSPCSDRSCLSPAVGCVGNTVSCDDNNLCTSDLCVVDVLTATKICQQTPVTCDDDNDCTIDTCVPSSGCAFTPKVCNDNDVCTDDACNPQGGNCTYTKRNDCVVTPSCLAAPCPLNPDQCSSTQCIGESEGSVSGVLYCNSPAVVAAGEDDACRADVARAGLNAYYCFTTPRRQCNGTTCYSQVCNASDGQCVFNASLSCDDNDPCTIDSCVQGVGCMHEQRTCERLDQCVNRVCAPSNSSVGNATWACIDDPNPMTASVVCADTDPCTVDTCDPSSGCKYTPKICDVPDACTITQCEPDTGLCNNTVLATLLDFCGTCGGDNTACFFQNTNDLKAAAGLAGGIVAAIVIVAVIALLAALYFCKKGYDHYQAASAMSAAGMHDNPTWKSDDRIGEMPEDDGHFGL